MRTILFFSLIALLFAFWPMNETQRQAWNHFWAIREAAPQEENQVYQQQTQQQFMTMQRPLANNNFHQGMDDLMLYKIQRKPLADPFSSSQFEYVLRR
jgi:hypothetical protein